MNEKLNKWMNEWMNERMNEWMNEWMNGWMDGWMDEWMNEWVSEWMKGTPKEFLCVLYPTRISIFKSSILFYFTLYKAFTQVYVSRRITLLINNH